MATAAERDRPERAMGWLVVGLAIAAIVGAIVGVEAATTGDLESADALLVTAAFALGAISVVVSAVLAMLLVRLSSLTRQQAATLGELHAVASTQRNLATETAANELARAAAAERTERYDRAVGQATSQSSALRASGPARVGGAGRRPRGAVRGDDLPVPRGAPEGASDRRRRRRSTRHGSRRCDGADDSGQEPCAVRPVGRWVGWPTQRPTVARACICADVDLGGVVLRSVDLRGGDGSPTCGSTAP